MSVGSTRLTIPQLFLQQAKRFGSNPLFHVKRAGSYQPITWTEAMRQIQALAAAWLTDGIAPGDRVAILSENRPEWALADLATLFCRAITVPVYATNTTKEVEYILRDAGASLVCVSNADQLQKVMPLCRGLPELKRLVVFDQVPSLPAGAVQLADLVSQRSTQATDLEALARQGDPDDLATLIYTSGTTGEPKGVMITHENFLSNCRFASRVITIDETDLHLSFLPLSHVFERLAGYYFVIFHGAAIAYAETLETVSQNILEVRPTLMLGVPRFFEKLHGRIVESLRHMPPLTRRIFTWAMAVGKEKLRAHDARRPPSFGLRVQLALAQALVYKSLHRKLGGRLKFCIAGGAPLAREIAEFFYALGVLILEGYGLTETATVISVNSLTAFKFGTVGRPLPGVEVRIADDGEILTRSPCVMKGYYRKEAETQAAFQDGWLGTGDIGHLDEDGFLVITDRKKDLIATSGGKKVAPSYLENLLKTDEAIADAFVYGERQRFLVALLVPNPEVAQRFAEQHGLARASTAELYRHPQVVRWMMDRVNARQRDLAAYHQIKRVALLDSAFSRERGELTPTLKVRRQIVYERYRSIIESLYRDSG